MTTRIERLANNSTMYYRGDTCMEISPFTNYYLFTIYRESNDESIDTHIPLNLTNLGTIWLSFINGKNKIRIPNYTQAENIDMANGEVVFRISEEQANRILALANKTFYISSAISDGKTSSDETVLYSGTWSEYSAAMKHSMTDTIQELKNTITSLNSKMTDDLREWTTKLETADNEIEYLKAENDRLNAKILELENQLSEAGNNYIEANIVNRVSKVIPLPANKTAESDMTNNAKLIADVNALKQTRLVSVFNNTTDTKNV